MRRLPALLVLTVTACTSQTRDVERPVSATLPQALVSSEVELGAGSQISTMAARKQLNPGAAMAGGLELIVWEDQRHSIEGDLFAALFDVPNRTIVASFPLVVGPGRQAWPSVASNGTHYLVVYEQGPSTSADIYGVYVSTAGVVGAPFPISATGANESRPSVSFGASRFMVAWTQRPGGTSGPISTVRFADGATPGAAETTGDGAFGDDVPAVGFDGQQFLLVWEELTGPALPAACTAMLRIPATGAIAAPSAGTCVSNIASPKQLAPSVATMATGNTTLVAWHDFRAGGFTAKVYAARVTAGVTVASDAAGVLVGNSPRAQAFPVAYGAGSSQFGVLWNENDFAGFSGLFDVSEPVSGNLVTWSNPQSPYRDGGDVATPMAVGSNPNSTSTGRVWSSTAGPGGADLDLFLNSNTPGSDDTFRLPLSTSQNGQESPAAAWGPQGQLVVWSDFQGYDAGTTGGFDLAYTFRPGSGGAATTNVIAAPGPQSAPAVASGSDNGFLAIWQSNFDLVGGIFTPSGTVRSSNLLVDQAPQSPSGWTVVYDGKQYVVFVTELDRGFSLAAFESIRVTVDGGVLDSVPRSLFLFTDGGYPTQPAAASNGAGTSLLVAAMQGPFASSPNSTIAGMLLLPDAGTKGPFYLPATRPSSPSADFDGRQFFVVWEDQRNLATGNDVYGARVDLNGNVLDATGAPLERLPGDSLHPAVSFNGNVHVLGWQQSAVDGGTYDVLGEVVTTDGGPLGAFAIATAENEVEPVAVSSGGQTLLAYTRWKSAPPYGASRVFGSVVSWGNGEACASNADCASGFCVTAGSQRFCCDKACNGVCETCAQTVGTCTPLPSTTVCRAADGGCDQAESCDGVNGACPADVPRPNGFACRAVNGGCDLAETCDGTRFVCPSDVFKAANTVCQNSVLLCAQPATCDGGSAECPANPGVQGPDVICRPASDAGCDVEEKCDGVNQMCPVDKFADSTVRCRSTGKDCDLDEFCTGNSLGCPPDLFKPSTQVCRPAGPTCDVAESCTGTAAECPADSFSPATQVCGSATSECQEAPLCSGTAATCAPSTNRPDGTSCDNGGGECQSGECQSLSHSRYGFKGCACDGTAGLLPLLGLLALGRRRRWSALAAAAVLVAGVASAEPKKLKLVFTGVAPGAGVSEETARSVAEYVQTELSNIGEYQVVSPTDLAAVLGVQRQKELLGCSDATGGCMAELAGALDADRLLRGDLSRIDETIVMNLSLIDLRKSEQVGRVGRRVESGGVSAALREVQPLLYELLNQTPEHKSAPLTLEHGFATVTVGVRGEGDVLSLGIAPSVFAELAGKYFGGALTVIATNTPGGRLEARFYPKTFPIARPYLSLGGVVFTTGLGVHGGAGVSVKFGHIVLSFDAAYERFVADFQKGYAANSVVLALGAGWAF